MTNQLLPPYEKLLLGEEDAHSEAAIGNALRDLQAQNEVIEAEI